MTDFLSPAERSQLMSRIRGKDTRPEIALRRALHGMGFRYRLHGAGLPGKPDLVFPRYKAAIFVHGCFWHRHSGCNIATTPKSNTPFWVEKFEKNVTRDKRVIAQLQEQGWTVMVVWECQVSNATKTEQTARDVASKLRSLMR
ncbi:DNA mismatch endonuclease Vsr [Herbaspirillum sp.]|uniref:very short patch repair endonuclease n=1 Tax=Herbaspirillum sp. TaxID=1890675 RepID=UPI0031D5F32F